MEKGIVSEVLIANQTEAEFKNFLLKTERSFGCKEQSCQI